MIDETVANLYKNLDELSELISHEYESGYVDQEKIHVIAEAMTYISEVIKNLKD